MKEDNLQYAAASSEPMPEQAPRRKKFHGFSMGFLLILLAVLVAVYIVCTIIAG